MLSFHVKFVVTDRQTDKRADRRTDGQTVKQYAPDLSIRGHKNLENKIKNVLQNG